MSTNKIEQWEIDARLSGFQQVGCALEVCGSQSGHVVRPIAFCADERHAEVLATVIRRGMPLPPGPDEPEGQDAAAQEETDKEAGRWQDAIRETVIRVGEVPDDLVDGAGCDSGDPLDVSLSEICQGLNYIAEQRDSARATLARAEACVEALREIATEIQQSNGSKGPSLPLNIFVLSIATKALAAYDAQPKEQK